MHDAAHTPADRPRDRGDVVTIKVGGSIQDDPAQLAGVAQSIAALARRTGRPCAVVHGGGKAISAAMTRAGLTARFVQGQRYTDGPTLAIAAEVLCGQVNAELCAALAQAGMRPAPLHALGACVLTASRIAEPDLGLVGTVEPAGVRTDVIRGLCHAGLVPVIAPVARDADGRGLGAFLNVNADLAGGAVAAALGSGAFLLVSDTPGVRTSAEPGSPCAVRLDPHAIDRLIASGVIDGGMLPKVRACLAALDAGADDVRIVDGRTPDCLAPHAPGTRVLRRAPAGDPPAVS